MLVHSSKHHKILAVAAAGIELIASLLGIATAIALDIPAMLEARAKVISTSRDDEIIQQRNRHDKLMYTEALLSAPLYILDEIQEDLGKVVESGQASGVLSLQDLARLSMEFVNVNDKLKEYINQLIDIAEDAIPAPALMGEPGNSYGDRSLWDKWRFFIRSLENRIPNQKARLAILAAINALALLAIGVLFHALHRRRMRTLR